MQVLNLPPLTGASYSKIEVRETRPNKIKTIHLHFTCIGYIFFLDAGRMIPYPWRI